MFCPPQYLCFLQSQLSWIYGPGFQKKSSLFCLNAWTLVSDLLIFELHNIRLKESNHFFFNIYNSVYILFFTFRH